MSKQVFCVTNESTSEIVYKGDDFDHAITLVKSNSNLALSFVPSSVEQSSEKADSSTPKNEDASTQYSGSPKSQNASSISSTLSGLLEHLEKLKMPDVSIAKVEEQVEKIVAEVNHLGVRGIKVVGEGFINLGELIRNSVSDSEQKNSNP